MSFWHVYDARETEMWVFFLTELTDLSPHFYAMQCILSFFQVFCSTKYINLNEPLKKATFNHCFNPDSLQVFIIFFVGFGKLKVNKNNTHICKFNTCFFSTNSFFYKHSIHHGVPKGVFGWLNMESCN